MFLLRTPSLSSSSSDALSDLSCDIDELMSAYEYGDGNDAPTSPPPLPRKSVYRQLRDSAVASVRGLPLVRSNTLSPRRNAKLFVDTGQASPGFNNRRVQIWGSKQRRGTHCPQNRFGGRSAARPVLVAPHEATKQDLILRLSILRDSYRV